MHTKNRGFRRLGKDVISRFTIPKFNKKSSFFTDTNSLGFIERKREPRKQDPIASQYFPITSQAFIKSGDNSNRNDKNVAVRQTSQLTLTLDRAAGAASLKSNQIEVMLHRRGMSDDNKGLIRPINDETETTGIIVVNFNELTTSEMSKLEKETTHTPKVVKSSLQSVNQVKTTALTGIVEINCKKGRSSCMLIDGHCMTSEFDLMAKCSVLKKSLPENVHLLSFKRDQFLVNMLIIRLEKMGDGGGEVLLEKLETYFSFRKKIVNVVSVGLAGIEGELAEDLDFPVVIDGIVTLRVYLE